MPRKRRDMGRKKGPESLLTRTRWPASIWEEQVAPKASAVATEASAEDPVLSVEGETDPVTAARIESERSTPESDSALPKYYTAQEVYEMLRPQYLAEDGEFEEQDPGEERAVVDEDEVSEEEVESRDEGFGGGREAEDFVEHTDVGEDGKVRQR